MVTRFESSERGSAIAAELVVTVFSDITDDGWIIDPVDVLSITAVDCELLTTGCTDCATDSVVVVSGICVTVLPNRSVEIDCEVTPYLLSPYKPSP
jgi:hypothetical protein